VKIKIKEKSEYSFVGFQPTTSSLIVEVTVLYTTFDKSKIFSRLTGL
jgi:hypothetical protein